MRLVAAGGDDEEVGARGGEDDEDDRDDDCNNDATLVAVTAARAPVDIALGDAIDDDDPNSSVVSDGLFIPSNDNDDARGIDEEGGDTSSMRTP